jgi:hypothetical protein
LQSEQLSGTMPKLSINGISGERVPSLHNMTEARAFISP